MIIAMVTIDDDYEDGEYNDDDNNNGNDTENYDDDDNNEGDLPQTTIWRQRAPQAFPLAAGSAHSHRRTFLMIMMIKMMIRIMMVMMIDW